jgi:hypothetical protein
MVRCRSWQGLASSYGHGAYRDSVQDEGAACPRPGMERSSRGQAPASRRGDQRFLTGVRLVAFFLLLVPFPALLVAQAPSSDTQSSASSQPAQSVASQSSSSPAPAATSAAQPPTGWQAFAQMQYGVSALGTVLMFDADLGYGFTDHLSGDVGVPVIFTRSPFSPVIDHDYYWSALLGEPYVDVKYTGVYHDINYVSVLTGTGPVANEDRIYSTGRFGVDWFNHLEEQVGSVTPFINLEASNGAVNRFVMPRPFEEARPYQSLGFLGDVEGGFDYMINTRFVKGVKLGGSAYLQAPAGPQKVFSRLVFPYSSLAGDGHHDRYFDSAFETTGTSAIARDNGFSVWLETNPVRNLDVQLAYTRSVHYDLDIYTVMFNFDAHNLVKNLFRRR